MRDDVVSDGLRALGAAHGLNVEISALRRLQGGNSSEIWAFDGQWQGHSPLPLILRSGMANEFALGGRSAEFEVLRALDGTGLPVPRVYWFDANGTHFGRPAMVMDRCSGTADRNLMGDRNGLGLSVPDRIAIGGDMMDLLAKLHEVDGLSVGGSSPWMSAEEHLAQYDEAIARLELEPSVELRLASWWLWRHLPSPPQRRVIVHGDYRPANILVDERRISAILDWEFTHLGDAAEDLGWFLAPYYAKEHLIPQAFGREDAIRRYEHARGISVDRAAVQFWSVFAMYKLAYMTVAALRWLIDGDPSRMADSAAFIVDPLLREIAA